MSALRTGGTHARQVGTLVVDSGTGPHISHAFALGPTALAIAQACSEGAGAVTRNASLRRSTSSLRALACM